MNIRRIQLSAIERELLEFLDKKEKLLGNKFLYNEKELETLSEAILASIEASELEIEQRFSEINADIAMRNKPE